MRIALGGNIPGECCPVGSCPSWELFDIGTVWGGVLQVEIIWDGSCPDGSCTGGSCPGGTCPGESCPTVQESMDHTPFFDWIWSIRKPFRR